MAIKDWHRFRISIDNYVWITSKLKLYQLNHNLTPKKSSNDKIDYKKWNKNYYAISSKFVLLTKTQFKNKFLKSCDNLYIFCHKHGVKSNPKVCSNLQGYSILAFALSTPNFLTNIDSGLSISLYRIRKSLYYRFWYPSEGPEIKIKVEFWTYSIQI